MAGGAYVNEILGETPVANPIHSVQDGKDAKLKASVSGTDVSVADDPLNPDNKVVKIDSTGRVDETAGIAAINFTNASGSSQAIDEKFMSFKIMIPTLDADANTAAKYFLIANWNASLMSMNWRIAKNLIFFSVLAHSADVEGFPVSNSVAQNLETVLDGYYIVAGSDSSINDTVAIERVLAFDTWYTVTLKLINASDANTVYGEFYLDGEFMAEVPHVSLASVKKNEYATTGSVQFIATSVKRSKAIVYFDDFGYDEPAYIGTTYSPYTAEQRALFSGYTDKVVNVTIEAGVATTDSQKYTVAYAGNVLTISGSSAIAEGDITAVIVNGKVYTGGWTITDGKLTANYTAE